MLLINDELPHLGPALDVDLTRRAVLRGLGGGGLAALLFAAGAGSDGVAAQDATPPPTRATGVSTEGLGYGDPAATPGLELTLRRVTIAPGGVVPA
ncbi:MAG: hypothetical protein M3Q10_17380, partial [Chloroflexota bacterium]|nr:hypothetical protein [Chloroflexota bacterium]